MTHNIEERVRAVAARSFELDTDAVKPDLKRGSIQAWDSMGHLNLMMELEREFAVRFSTKQIEELKSLDEITAVLATEAKR